MDELMTAPEAIAFLEKSISENLQQCCIEKNDLNTVGLYKTDGLIRKFAIIAAAGLGSYHISLDIVCDIIHKKAIEKCAKGD